jgi:hypothetical protein
MSCDCDECLEHVDCDCPSTTGITGATTVAYVNNVYTPAQDISGPGFNIVLYTNSSAVTQTVLVETNMYLIGSEATSVTTSKYLRSAVALSGSAVALKEGTPLKSDHTHFLLPTTLTAGQNISITVQGSVGAPTLKWLKSTVYMYI